MKRFKIRNIESQTITHQYEAEEALPHQFGWGEQEKQILRTLEDGTMDLDGDGNPQFDITPATYEVVEEDMTEELRLADIAAYTATREAQAEAAIQAILAPSEDVTHLMLAIYDIYIALD